MFKALNDWIWRGRKIDFRMYKCLECQQFLLEYLFGFRVGQTGDLLVFRGACDGLCRLSFISSGILVKTSTFHGSHRRRRWLFVGPRPFHYNDHKCVLYLFKTGCFNTMFHQHIKTDVEGFRKTIDSPQCTACMLMQHKDTAHSIVRRAGVTHVSLDKAFELKQRIIKHKPHLKRAMNELLPAEDRKSRSKSSLGVVGSIIFAIGTLLALTGLEAVT